MKLPICKLIFSQQLSANSLFLLLHYTEYLALLFCPLCAAPIVNTRTAMCAHWLGKQQPCGSVVRSRRGDCKGVARRRQPGNSLNRWVGSGAGDRGHTCCLPGAHTHTFLIHSAAQPLHQPLCRFLLHTHTCTLDSASFAALLWKHDLKQTVP